MHRIQGVLLRNYFQLVSCAHMPGWLKASILFQRSTTPDCVDVCTTIEFQLMYAAARKYCWLLHTFGFPTVVKSLSFSPGIPVSMACSMYPMPLVGTDGAHLRCLLGLPDGQISSKLGTM